MMPQYESELQRAEVTHIYREDLIKWLGRLSEDYDFFLEEKMNLHYDEMLFTQCCSQMIMIMTHLLPKLEGGGKKTEDLFKQMKTFEPWLTDAMIPKLYERERVSELLTLIVKAYDLLGLSPL